MEKWLKKELKYFDIVHLHNFRCYQHVITCKYAIKYNIPYIVQAHGSLPLIIEKQDLKKLFDIVWGNKILFKASKVIALTNVEAEQYKRMGVQEDKIEIVPNGIDLSEYEQLPRKGEFRRKYLIRDNERIILFLGRIHRIKGIDLLVDAFSDITRKLEDCRLVIVGPDDGFLLTLKVQIEDLKISDRILFTGPLYDVHKIEAYVDADVYVLPSVYETFPVTVLEACACGTPVIVTNRCGIADVVDGVVGCVVNYDRNQLQNAILMILSNEELRKIYGEEGKKLVKKEFGWANLVKKIEDNYIKISSSIL